MNLIKLDSHIYDKNGLCPPDFDGKYCWPPTLSKSFAEIRCPRRMYDNQTITRWCSTNISEIVNLNITVPMWENAYYANCPYLEGRAGDITYIFALTVTHNDDDSYLEVNIY